ncbi:MAG: DNA alkylation repair protein [Phyllobacteriaceae bacterium]|nr:DNA alkylation repair protein [Phyllobacteriaceae bacterium]MBA90447.1 DNA alkylation repair protein [Phyllobacteriaceae bacterium]
MTMDRSATVESILHELASMESDRNKAGMARYGIRTDKAFGVPNSILRPMGRQIGRNHARALDLWETGWREARLLAAFTAEKRKLTRQQAESWAADFDSWEIVDGTADLFADTDFWPELVAGFAADEREFVRRAAFATLVWACVHRKKEPDGTFIDWLPLIERHATDPRNFVRKAVNWALRQIGKRSMACHGPALALAERLAASKDATARWIGRDAARELQSDKTLARLQRHKARPHTERSAS